MMQNYLYKFATEIVTHAFSHLSNIDYEKI